VSLVYSRGGAGLQQQLLGQLLGLLQGTAGAAGGAGTTAAGAAGVKLAPETKLFEEGQLGNTPGEGQGWLGVDVGGCPMGVGKVDAAVKHGSVGGLCAAGSVPGWVRGHMCVAWSAGPSRLCDWHVKSLADRASWGCLGQRSRHGGLLLLRNNNNSKQ